MKVLSLFIHYDFVQIHWNAFFFFQQGMCAKMSSIKSEHYHSENENCLLNKCRLKCNTSANTVHPHTALWTCKYYTHLHPDSRLHLRHVHNLWPATAPCCLQFKLCLGSHSSHVLAFTGNWLSKIQKLREEISSMITELRECI